MAPRGIPRGVLHPRGVDTRVKMVRPDSSERDLNLAAYDQRRAALEAKHRGEYVAVAGGCIVGVYPSFEEADNAVAECQEKLVFEIGTQPALSPVRAVAGRKLGTIAR